MEKKKPGCMQNCAAAIVLLGLCLWGLTRWIARARERRRVLYQEIVSRDFTEDTYDKKNRSAWPWGPCTMPWPPRQPIGIQRVGSRTHCERWIGCFAQWYQPWTWFFPRNARLLKHEIWNLKHEILRNRPGSEQGNKSAAK
jgi:hypothetical protein